MQRRLEFTGCRCPFDMRVRGATENLKNSVENVGLGSRFESGTSGIRRK
jgi:hypothetical protein